MVRIAVCVWFWMLWSSPAWADAWRQIDEAQGVVVDVRDVEGQDFPEFRGTGVIEAPMLHVASVISDLTRTCQWTARCAASKEVSRKTEFDRIFYTRTAAPFPFNDRDGVLHAVVSGNIKEQKEFSIKFESVVTPLMPPIDGVVRMTRLRGYYTLTAQGPTTTKVVYGVVADPGGVLPQWLTKKMAKSVPRDTVLGLRRQSLKTLGDYDAQIQRWLAMP